MDSAMEVVFRQCGRYVQSYSKCVEKFPDTWHIDCELARSKLATCAEDNPVVSRVKEECATSYGEYEKCLQANPVQVERCSGLLDRFNQCANTVAQQVTDSS
ncbi:coiled-coil-helix-coiled-coil-helix domain-containing protein 5-like [Argonauta hians]